MGALRRPAQGCTAGRLQERLPRGGGSAEERKQREGCGEKAACPRGGESGQQEPGPKLWTVAEAEAPPGVARSCALGVPGAGAQIMCQAQQLQWVGERGEQLKILVNSTVPLKKAHSTGTS